MVVKAIFKEKTNKKAANNLKAAFLYVYEYVLLCFLWQKKCL